MNYQISEEDFYSLESARDQLSFITGLLASARENEGLTHITVSQLVAFVGAQQATVTRVIEAASQREAQASAARVEEAAADKVPQVSIAPELLMGLMDAACGDLTDSEGLIKLWYDLYDAGVEHRPYMDALNHFLGVMRARGLVVHIQSIDGLASRAFAAAKQTSNPKGAAPAKPRKRDKLARVEG